MSNPEKDDPPGKPNQPDPYGRPFRKFFCHWDRSDLERIEAKLATLISKVDQIMAKVDDYITAATAAFASMATSVDGLVGDVANLNSQIADLKTQLANAGLTQAQSDALDGLQATATTIAGKLDALDQVTPPVAPPAP